ncbi:MAG TPA: cytochrome c biogenesis protein ResB [Candidatus Limnocylindrales bacterium]|nr:cytochrome c biogenesis protein ResB [Candidatus Limnocylindrales bacterium]
MPSRAAVAAPVAGDRLVRGAERLLRLIGDARTGLVLLVLTGLANALAALLPEGPARLDGWPYAILLGALVVSGVAAVAVRSGVVWREWRRPTPVQAGAGTLRLLVASAAPDEVERSLGAAGYRVRREERRGRWAVHGVRRGWSRYAGLASHLALVVVVLGAAIGAAFGSETVFSLLRGDQALLDAPRSGFASAVRLEALDAEFGPDARPRRLDTTVTFLRDGEPVREAILRANEPGEFDGYLVHPWTYGPAVRLRVTTLGGSPLLDAPVPLDGTRDGVPVGSAELPTAGVTLGLALTDAASNELGVSVVDGDGLVDSARLVPGDVVRVGSVQVELTGFDAWVTFMSRRDPGLLVLFGGAAALCISLAVAFWVPRRRLTVRPSGAGLELLLRGERFDRPADELERLGGILGAHR